MAERVGAEPGVARVRNTSRLRRGTVNLLQRARNTSASGTFARGQTSNRLFLASQLQADRISRRAGISRTTAEIIQRARNTNRDPSFARGQTANRRTLANMMRADRRARGPRPGARNLAASGGGSGH